MNNKIVTLGDLIEPAKVRKAGQTVYPILSMTMKNGLVDQSNKFKKRVASIDTSNYKIISKSQLVVGFPIDEGVLAFQEIYEEAIVSPAYDVWNLKAGLRVDFKWLELYLRSPYALSFYASKLRGTTARRRTLPDDIFLSLKLNFPPLEVQQKLVRNILLCKEIQYKRAKMIEKIESLAQAIFFEMFGDLEFNEKKWRNDLLLRDVAIISSGITKGRKIKGAKLRSVPYMAVLNVQDKRLNLQLVKTIDVTEEEVERYRLNKNDLLLTEGGDPDKLGRGTLWNNELPECIHQNHVFKVRVESDIVNPVFLNWLIGSSMGKKYFLKAAKQTTGIATINSTQLKNFPLLLPPISLQNEFAMMLEKIKVHKVNLIKAEVQIEDLSNALYQQFFKGTN